MALAVAVAGCGGDNGSGSSEEAQGTVDPADCTAEVDNPFVPLSTVAVKEFRGTELDQDTGETVATRAEMRVQEETAEIAGFPVSVVEVKEYEDGELVERTLDYYSQCSEGSVWYIGEKVDDYEDGMIVGHEGQWQAGEGDARAGLFMPAEPQVGETFEQEQAPGVAEDRSTVVEEDVDVTTPAGDFTGCIKTEDVAPLDDITEFKYYCPEVGLVREERPGVSFDLVRYA